MLVTVKARDTQAAGAALAPIVGKEAIVVSLQNGVHNGAQLDAALSPRAVVAGMVGFNVLGKGETHFHQATSGRLAIAQLPTGVAPPIAAALVQAGIATDVVPDLAPILWGKLLFNLNNAVNALANVPLAEQLASRGYRRIMAAVIREGHAVLTRAQIAAEFDAPVPTSWIPPLMELPTPIFKLLARKMVNVDPSARSSMWEDLQRGRTDRSRPAQRRNRRPRSQTCDRNAIQYALGGIGKIVRESTSAVAERGGSVAKTKARLI